MTTHHEQDILKRNAELEKELAAKNHELEIEAALERVRSRTNTMHRSENLHEVIIEVNDQLRQLGFRFDGTDFLTDYSGKGYNIWIANFPTPIYVPAIDHKIFDLLKEVIKRGDNFFTFTLTTEEKNIHFKNIFENTIAKNSPEELKQYVYNAKGMASSCVVLENIILSVTNFASIPYTDTENGILKRFANVFERSYTRFLDLQKAEAQAREAQIELGLERVRARAMAMQHSDELKELIGTVYCELTKLDLALDRCLIWIMNSEDLSSRLWMANAESQPVNFYIPHHDNPPYLAFVKAWKDRNKRWQYDLHGQVKKEWDGFVFNQSEMKHLPDQVKKNMQAADRVMLAASFHNFGCLQTAGPEPLKEEQFDILNRFAKVFDLTYTRFNDLKQAEAQARESQIELGLERVRARAMAMQKSGELSELVDTVFKELTKLDFALTWCIINIIDESSMSNTVWAAHPDINKAPESYHMLFEDYPYHHAMLKDWKEREVKSVYTLEGDEKRIYDDYLFSETEFKRTPEIAQAASRAMEKYVCSFSFCNFGGLQTVGDAPLSDANLDILSRFGKVFDLTYTRFNDLKQAEAQARESQIETALEKIRSRSLAMHKSDELWEVIAVVFEKFQELNFAIDGAAFITTFIEGTREQNAWVAGNDSQPYPTSLRLPYLDSPVINDIWQAKESGPDFLSKTYCFEEKNHWLRYAFENTGLKSMTDEWKNWILEQPYLTQTLAFGKTSMIGIHFHYQKTLSDTEIDILKRFSKVFDQAYTRFLDLQKAEAQARESQIQLALERVRARTMAMQKSDELQDAASLMVQQIQTLGVPQFGSGFNIWDDDRKVATAWMCNVITDNLPPPFKTSSSEDIFLDIHDAAQRGESLFVREQAGKELETHYKYMNSIPIFREYVERVFVEGFSIPDFQIMHCAFFSQGYLMFITYKPVPEAHDIFKRFAKVFEQTYTRFLDLQKAEAQARESQIQLALERVRARTMAMQHSEELREAASLLFKQIADLGTRQWSSGFDIWNANEVSAVAWMSNPDGSMGKPFNVPYTEDPFFKKIYQARQSGEDFFVMESSGKELEETYQYLFNLPEAKKHFDGVESLGFQMPTFQITHCAFFSHGYLMFITFEAAPEMWDIFKRFAKVFEQTYTRFLDLQTAEAQAREAQIQLALERVRARTMAMQHSDELKEAAALLFQQVKSLGAPAYSCGYNIWEENEKEFTSWMSTQDGSIINGVPNIPLTEDANFIRYVESKQKGEQFFVLELRGERMQEHYEYLKTIPAFKAYFHYAISVGFDLPETQIHHLANFSHGNLLFITLAPCPEFHDVFKRFAAVFEQTYTRFLDLQKAEAQARESQIQLALERVRARTMAMQKSDELPQAANLLFQQVQSLGMPAWSAGYCIWDDDKQAISLSMSSEGILQPTLKMPLTEDPSLKHFREAFERGESFFVEEVGGETLKEHYTYLRTLPGVKETLDDIEKAGFPVPTFQIFHLAYFTQGFLLFITYEPVPESHDIFKRFAKVFEQTYTRFLDLQKAEAQAREAQIETSLERIRSRTMGMQKSNELRDVAALLSKELISLGITQFASCGYVEIEEKNNRQRSWLTNPDGTSLEAFYLPLTGEHLFNERYEAWKRKDVVFKQVVHAKELKKHLDFAYSGFGSQESENVGRNFFPDPTIFYNSNFSYGYLSLITGVMLDQAEELLLARFTRMFEQTYSRFLDLQKAEALARESQIQLALERVRARTMAMQKSDELPETSYLLFQQVKELGETTVQNSIGIVNEEAGFVELSTTVQGHHLPHTLNVPINDPYVMAKAVAAWKAKRKSLKLEFEGQELKNYNEHRNSFFETKVNFPEDQWIVNIIFFSKGWLSFSSDKSISDETFELLKRFAAVFEQTYIRFNDLKQAEEQARESQIQLALERVRARTMAMQKSDELMETAVVLFDQLKQLGENIERTIIGVMNEEERVLDAWATRPDGTQMEKMQKFPIDEPILMQKVYAAWRQQKKSIVMDLRGEELESYFQFLNSRGPKLKRENFGERRVENFAFFSKGMLGVINVDPNTTANVGLYERFAAVFDQTYTRFLDLQKSEAQAREAQIEAALERVRSRSMGMQKSEELKEVIQVVYDQFVHLNIHVEHTGFVMDYKARDDYDIWIADQLGVPSHVTIPYFDSVYYNRFNEAKEKGEDLFTTNLTFEEKNKFYQKIIEYVPGLPEETKEFLFSIPGLAASTVLLENIGLYIENFSGIPYSDEENNTLMRFGKVFQQTYTRFLDLQKAEAQAKEAKIEAALEKVRSRTMGMQRSEELGDVATVLFKEMNKLVENLWTCGFVLCERDRAEDEWWLSSETGFIPSFYLPNTGDATHENIYNGWKNGETYHTEQLEGEALKEHYEWLYNIQAAKRIFDEMIAGGFSLPTWQKLHCAYFSKGYLCIITQVPCKEEQVFKRFAQVFDLTYTRFLDLQKAEAQAREAKIEAALERVRSRSMAMHHTSELQDVINTVYQQFGSLNIAITGGAFIAINEESKKEIACWGAGGTADYVQRVHIPFFDRPIYTGLIDAIQKGPGLFTDEFTYEEKIEFFNHIFKYPPNNEAPPERKKEVMSREGGYTRSLAVSKNTSVFIINHHGRNFSEEENKILIRFGNVFEQSYTRFLDLQKAEAQAREAKIEAALERVRASTMAMQHSDHLSETAFVLFKQFKELGEAPERIFIATFDNEQDGIIDIWGTNQGGNQLDKLFKVPADEPTVISKIITAWKEKKRSVVIDLSGEELKQYISFLKSTGMPVTEGIMEDRRVQTIGCFSKGVIGVTTPEPQSAESVQLLERFAGVFDLTYTRFLDLQQAEGQAREAKIEAALERVRSRTMAMQRSAELAEVATILFQQVKALGVPQWTCGFGIFEIDDKEFTWYPGDADGDILQPCKIPLTEHPVFISFNESRKRGDELFVYEKEGEVQADHYRYMMSLPGMRGLLQNMLDAGLTFPAFQIDHVANFSHGNLVFITYEPFPEMHDVFKRFAKVFDQTYTRFLDLQKSEAQAREAIKQASVDRIRAEIASMRTTNDLERIQPLIWNELTTLGVPFTRCGVFIMDEEHEQVDTFLSTPEGKSIASFTSNYSDAAVITEALPYWRKKEIYKAHWDEATFLAQAQTLLSQGNITSTESYLTEHRPKDLYLHFLPFLQGILYVGNETPLNDDELQLVQNLADAFSIAYARYEDFNKLEVAKEQIENTLTNLKQAQAQLVQSEKMASLGELTAGIAHEIQNPLNFVNNFSEVNTELIAEMKVEIEMGNIEEVKAIANDISENEQKINHHGKRADAIVKGMLQHSRSSSGVKEPSDINVLADEYLRLAYHGLRAKDKSFNATMKTDFDETIGKINIVPQDVGRSVLNLITNAFYAVSEKKKQIDEGLPAEAVAKAGYEPTVTVTTKRTNGKVEIRVADNGNGIPQKVLDKIFQPFFTTKPTGQGTGLGLSLSYDIVKAHGGEINVKTREGEGTEFNIQLPV